MNKKYKPMKLCDLGARVDHVCNYIIAGVESEALFAKFEELCKIRARAMALESEICRALNKYEGV